MRISLIWAMIKNFFSKLTNIRYRDLARFLFCKVSIFILTVCALALSAQAEEAYHPYGLIEIGAKGVKSFTFDFDRAEANQSCNEREDAYRKCLNIQILKPINCNAMDPQQVAVVIQSVNNIYSRLVSEYHIIPNHIYVVGSSSMEKAQHKAAIVDAIKLNVNPINEIGFITSEQEALYSFSGTLGSLPERWRKLREKQTVVIDIGSGNIKASYLSVPDKYTVTTAGIDYGTKKASDEISDIVKEANAQGSSVDFVQAAERWRTTVFVPELHRQLDNYPGFANSNRFYLIGGISWAMAYLTYPEGKTLYTPIKPTDIDKFLSTASLPDGASRLCSDDRKSKYGTIKDICGTFTINNLIAGGEMLKALSEELEIKQNRKNIFFFDVIYAWDLGYLREKLFPRS